jgi:hypothetical protein
MTARFPFLPVFGSERQPFLMPMLPLQLRFNNGDLVEAQGLLDSGATVNVMPYNLGIRLGAVWENQTTRVKLSGNLGGHDARALIASAKVAEFSIVPLVFAWTRVNEVPLLLGQVNFFDEFTVVFRRAKRIFEIEPAMPGPRVS